MFSGSSCMGDQAATNRDGVDLTARLHKHSECWALHDSHFTALRASLQIHTYDMLQFAAASNELDDLQLW